MSRAQVLVQKLREVGVAVPRGLDSCEKHSYMRVLGRVSPTGIELFCFVVDGSVGTGVRNGAGERIRRHIATDVRCGAVNECGVAVWERSNDVSPLNLVRQASGGIRLLDEAVVRIKRLAVGQYDAMRVVFVLIKESVRDVDSATVPDVVEAMRVPAAEAVLAAVVSDELGRALALRGLARRSRLVQSGVTVVAREANELLVRRWQVWDRVVANY